MEQVQGGWPRYGERKARSAAKDGCPRRLAVGHLGWANLRGALSVLARHPFPQIAAFLPCREHSSASSTREKGHFFTFSGYHRFQHLARSGQPRGEATSCPSICASARVLMERCDQPAGQDFGYPGTAIRNDIEGPGAQMRGTWGNHFSWGNPLRSTGTWATCQPSLVRKPASLPRHLGHLSRERIRSDERGVLSGF